MFSTLIITMTTLNDFRLKSSALIGSDSWCDAVCFVNHPTLIKIGLQYSKLFYSIAFIAIFCPLPVRCDVGARPQL